MLSSREVAEELGVSIDAVRRAIKSGALTAYKPCGRIRVREEDLQTYLDGRRIGARPQPRQRPAGRGGVVVSRASNLPRL
jgi:excisionase family DNA binding protein